jgi:hypothetical protein
VSDRENILTLRKSLTFTTCDDFAFLGLGEMTDNIFGKTYWQIAIQTGNPCQKTRRACCCAIVVRTGGGIAVRVVGMINPIINAIGRTAKSIGDIDKSPAVIL